MPSVRLSLIAFSLLLLLPRIEGASVFARDVVIRNETSARSGAPLAESANSAAVTNILPIPDIDTAALDRGPRHFVPGFATPEGAFELARIEAFGSSGLPYSATRVQDGPGSISSDGPNHLSTTYPYRAVGRFTSSTGYCTATLIRRSIIVTAAHCVQHFGHGNVTFTDFTFTPGYWGKGSGSPSEAAPYGSWGWASLVRPGSWADGTDPGIGAARENDLAVIALAPDSKGRFVGDLTGYINYAWNNFSFVSSALTGGLVTAAVTSLGYPSQIDRGAIMQRTDGPAYTATIGRVPQLVQGSNFTSGASGGPWIVNFRTRSGKPGGSARRGKKSTVAVVGVTSWGSSDPNDGKDNWASQFGQNTHYPNAGYGIYGAGNIGSLLYTLCESEAPGGGRTLAAAGYCDADSPTGATDLLTNGGFECGPPPPTPPGYLTLNVGSTELCGWVVTSGNIDVNSTWWIPSEGGRSLDLNGTQPGAVAQSFSTVPGRTYYVSFDMAGNTIELRNRTAFMEDATDDSSETFSVNVGDYSGPPFLQMDWTPKSWTFVASGTTTTLEFSSKNLSSGAGGPALDNVRVTDIQ